MTLMEIHPSNTHNALLIGLLLISGLSLIPGVTGGKISVAQVCTFQKTFHVQSPNSGIIFSYGTYADFVWSPDSEKVAFASYFCGVSDIYVIDADGCNLKRLTHNDRADSPVWSPDGKIIAFDAVKNQNEDIFVMDTDGGNKKRLTKSPDGDSMVIWSPDGKIIFLRTKEYVSHFYIMDADGSNQKQLLNIPGLGRCYDPVLSPDGKKVVFSSKRSGNEDIYVIEIGESTPQRLTDDHLNDFHPVWSPDGEMIAFGRGVSFGTSEIYTMNADGSSPRKLIDDVPWNVHLAWAPDGTSIAFDSERDGNYEIYVITIDGKTLERLTEDAAKDQHPVWSPDGTKILYKSEEDGVVTLSVIDAGGNGKITLATLYGDGPLWYCFVTSQLVIWLFSVVVIGALAFFSFMHTRDHMHERIKVGLRAGVLCGIGISVVMVAAEAMGSSIYSEPFQWILLVSFGVPGVLIVYSGKNVIKGTDDLVISVAAAGFVFSLFFVCATTFFNIHSGDFDILETIGIFVVFFFPVFLLSVGSGGLFAQHILKRPIPKKILPGQSPVLLYCPHCGMKIETWDICPHCGSDLKNLKNLKKGTQSTNKKLKH